ncbi:plasmid mobilization relaxosome protein MobC [Streptomyces tibetensis]|uniref:Plasmid mobilization relaxosome protein MobC n=1 Tax=Streptomyces tibetensis TaxID=2382123 RepID=A0ABW6MVW2_9ACTN
MQPSAPRRRLRQPRLREHRAHPRYSDGEFAELARAADVSRMPIGGYVAEASLAAARAEDPSAAVADYRAMVKALMAANGQLGGVGNNLNQLTWHLNKDGAGPAPGPSPTPSSASSSASKRPSPPSTPQSPRS